MKREKKNVGPTEGGLEKEGRGDGRPGSQSRLGKREVEHTDRPVGNHSSRSCRS